jgi:DNA-binding YbaB/EbfC family protein
MAKRGGFQGGMPGNMNNLMKQAQRMQRQMEEQAKALEEKEYTAQTGGSAVSIKMNGKKEVIALTLDPEAVDPDDVEMLQDLIVAAFNEASRQVDEESSAAMNKMTGGLGGLSF